MRIVSLLPSATEIVCALGLGDSLVGVSHECDWPPEVVGLPMVTEPKLDPAATSVEIDTAVRRLVGEGQGVYRLRTDVLAMLRPDLIVTQEQCEVCAVPHQQVVEAARRILGDSVRIVSLKSTVLADILADIERVAGAIGCEQRGAELVQRLRGRVERLRERAARARSRPRVACLEWLQPLMVAGNWVPELVDIAGGRDPFTAPGEPSTSVGWERLAAEAPDVIILMPCGYRLAQTEKELPQLRANPHWDDLPAVRNGRVYAIDGNTYVNRPGPRIAESAELLAGLIQPGFFASLIPANSYARVS